MSARTSSQSVQVNVGAAELYLDYPVKASTHVYAGTFVGLASGYLRNFTNTDIAVGLCVEDVNNDVATDGAKVAKVQVQGSLKYAVTGAAITSVGAKVYVTDNQTLTTTGSNYTNFLGTIQRYDATSGLCDIEFGMFLKA